MYQQDMEGWSVGHRVGAVDPPAHALIFISCFPCCCQDLIASGTRTKAINIPAVATQNVASIIAK